MEGPWPPWMDFEIFSKKNVVLSVLSGKKNFTTFGPGKVLKKSPSVPPAPWKNPSDAHESTSLFLTCFAYELCDKTIAL